MLRPASTSRLPQAVLARLLSSNQDRYALSTIFNHTYRSLWMETCPSSEELPLTKANLRTLSVSLLLVVSTGTSVVAQTESRSPGAHWLQYATPEEAGYASAGLADAHALADSLGSAAVMFIQNGAVVTAWGDITRPENVHSIAKSVQSALVGTAVAEGMIDLDATLSQLGIDDDPPLSASESQARVRDLLTMRSGVLHNAAYAPFSEIPPERERPAPGTQFRYTNWNVNALEAIFQRTTGVSFPEAVHKRLAVPLQMEDFNRGAAGLWSDPTQSRLPHPILMLSTRDLARFGLLYLNRGRWNNEQIVTEEWVEESTRSHVDAGPYADFGYLWWIPKGVMSGHGAFMASGTGNQSVIVLPGLNAVFVHRASALGGGVNGLDAYNVLFRILRAHTENAGAAPRLVPFAPSRINGSEPD